MHRFYMVQSFTRFHRNVRTVCHSHRKPSIQLSVSSWTYCGAPSSSGHCSCGTLPRCQGGGAASKAGTCHQGGPCLPQPSGAVSRRPQRCECFSLASTTVWLIENVSSAEFINFTDYFLCSEEKCIRTLLCLHSEVKLTFECLSLMLWCSLPSSVS